MLTETNLNQFTGTTCYYRYMLGLKLLPGLCSKCITEVVLACIDLLREALEVLLQDNNIDEGTPMFVLRTIAKKISKALRL